MLVEQFLILVGFLLKVGYAVAHLVDKGTTAVMRAGRVHKEFDDRKSVYALAYSVGGLAVQKGAEVMLSTFCYSDLNNESSKPEPRYKCILNLVKYFIIRRHD